MSIGRRGKFGYGRRSLRLKAFDTWGKITFVEGFYDLRTGGGCGPFPIFSLYLEIRLSSMMENHVKKRIHGSRRQLGTARSVDLAVLFTESLDCPADFRSLSADAPDDCVHPSVITSVFQVAELGACLHQLVLSGKARL
jgi:hypothetical protein